MHIVVAHYCAVHLEKRCNDWSIAGVRLIITDIWAKALIIPSYLSRVYEKIELWLYGFGVSKNEKSKNVFYWTKSNILAITFT